MNSASKTNQKHPGGVVARVRPGSEAAALGLLPGDVIVAMNGLALHDVIDYQFYAADGQVEMLVQRNGQRFTVHAEGDGPLGIEFAEASFDGIRHCANRCLFCFVDQLPPSLRESLYVKDDDYRYSALYGNFVTLTNWKEKDWRRVAEQHVGPLHVSVHCTDLTVRRHLLGNPKAPDILPQLRRLTEGGTRVHAQIVLCPGINDGQILERTVTDLMELHPGVQSIGVVPVAVSSKGLRRSSESPRRQGGTELGEVKGICSRRLQPARPRSGSDNIPLRSFDLQKAATVIADVRRYQAQCRKKLHVGFVYAADEFYLLAGEAVPPTRGYDGFPQYENGIGMVRSLEDGWGRLMRRLLQMAIPPSRKITVVCGRLIEPVLRCILDDLASITNWSIDLVPVTNRLFGPEITVSGLLSGRDVLDALAGRDFGDCVVLPRSMLDNEGVKFLDDMTPGELELSLGRPVRFAMDMKELVEVC
ncbi:MAG: DUF512 domain-containing protein [Chloroflexi bacterium]|nr:DUF512 domain-containing protein [Chloroflexota bacterium]